MSELSVVKEEHEFLMHGLRSVKLKGGAGKLFGDMMNILEMHFAAEEDTVMPLLATLQELAKGIVPEQRLQLIDAFHELERSYERMLDEHSRIKSIASNIIGDGKSLNIEVASLLESLLHHAAMEEEILYPSALLAGRLIEKSINSS